MMTEFYGYAGQILKVDLSSGTVSKEPLPSTLVRDFLGGRGFNMRTLYSSIEENTDPRGPENPLVFGVGPVNGTHSCLGSRFNVSAKSPHTGILGDSNAGGHLGSEIKYAGYDQIIITGCADSPVYLLVSDDQVELRDARHIWGQDIWQTHETIRGELGDSSVQIAACGPAAENGVSFSGVFANLVRAAGRTGMGAVMASKKLKALVVRGSGSVRVFDNERFREWDRVITQRILDHPDYESRAWLGTPRNVLPLNQGGYLVTKHFQSGFFPEAHKMSGEELARHFNVKPKACHACPLHCGRWYVVPSDRDFAGLQGEGPEYEAMAGFGSRVYNSNLAAILKCNDLCNRLGMDAITTSEVISWLMELHQLGMVAPDEVDGLDLSWGNVDTLIALIQKIARREGVGDLLADGVRAAAERLGRGSELAMHVKGLEIIQAEPRGMKGYALTFATATRGADHLRYEPFFEMSGDAELAIKRYGMPEPAFRLEEKGKGLLVADFGEWCALSDCLNVCKNTMVCMEVLEISELPDFLHALTGMEWSEEDVRNVGKRMITLEYALNNKMGIRREDDTLPRRFIEDPLPEDSRESAGSVVDLDPMLTEFYQARGIDPETGIPREKTCLALGLRDVARDVAAMRRQEAVGDREGNDT